VGGLPPYDEQHEPRLYFLAVGPSRAITADCIFESNIELHDAWSPTDRVWADPTLPLEATERAFSVASVTACLMTSSVKRVGSILPPARSHEGSRQRTMGARDARRAPRA